MTDKQKIKELQKLVHIQQQIINKQEIKIEKFNDFFKFIKEQIKEEL